MNDFHTAVRHHCGKQWLDTWWSAQRPKKSSLDFESLWVHGTLPPSSLLEFALQIDLLLFAEQELREEISRNPKIFRDPKLLYYMACGNAYSQYVGSKFYYHSPQRWRGFAKFLLQNGFDPNMAIEIAVGPDRGKLMNNVIDNDTSGGRGEHGDEYDDEEGDEEGDENADDSAAENPQPITIMHLALAMACSATETIARPAYNRLNMLQILVEGGGDAMISNYRNLWSSKKNIRTKRSAIHYLLSSMFNNAMPFESEEPENNHALTECITAFLNHGADPNTVDSNGVSILECALPVCPPELIELMLEKGGKVTPKLLLKSGEPVGYAGGILKKPRWRRPEYYTVEARVIARRYNPDWPDFEEDERD